jgi:hypothetical protein
MVARWRASREFLPASERHLVAVLDAALEAYGARLHPGESIFREPGASRFRTWLARLDDLWEQALGFLDRFGFCEDVRTPWVALHHAYGFDDRVPHDTRHCGLCLLKADAERSISPDRVLAQRVRFGPVPRDVVPFCVAERIELLSTYSCPPDRPGWEFAPVARSIAGGGLDRNELIFEPGVDGALDHIGLLGVLRDNKVKFTVTPVQDDAGSGEPSAASNNQAARRDVNAPVGEAGRVREALRAQLRSEVHRWLVQTGREPTEQDWSKLSDWPSGELIAAAYGSFAQLIEDCELQTSELLRRTRALEREHDRARGLGEHAKRRLEAVAARERDVAKIQADRSELELAAGQAPILNAQLKTVQERLNTMETERARLQRRLADTEREREAAADNADTSPPHPMVVAAPRAERVESGLPLYRLWLGFDAAIAAEQLLGVVAQWIDPAAAERLCATNTSGDEFELADRSTVVVDRLTNEGDWLWQASWRQACEREQDDRFHTRAVVCARGPERHVGLEVRLMRADAPLAPTPALGFRAPELPALLLAVHSVTDGAWPLRAHALELRDRGDAEDLAEFLYSEHRRRPVVHCSARRRGPSLDAHRLARELAGLAHVTYTNDGRVDDALNAQLAGTLGAWGGAVRVYYPGLAPGIEHRYTSAQEINRRGEGPTRGRLLRDLGQLACATMGEPEAIGDVRRRALDARATQRPTAPDRPAEHDAQVQVTQLLDEHDRALRELEHARQENERLHQALEHQQQLSERQARQITELSRHLAPTPAAANSDSNANHHHDHPNTSEARPRTVAQAVKLAMGHAKHLVYAPNAVESAKDCPYHRPDHILDALQRLDQLAEGYLDPNGIGCSLDERARQLGLRWQGGLQDSIIARYPNHYTISYQDRRWKLGPHIALGGGDGGERLARIYLVAHPGDQDTARSLIVGHVGRHLPDSSTG